MEVVGGKVFGVFRIYIINSGLGDSVGYGVLGCGCASSVFFGFFCFVLWGVK